MPAGCIRRSTSTSPIQRAIWTTFLTGPGTIGSAGSSRTRSDSADRMRLYCWGPSMLEGKSIVVTGASRGIGRAIAIACAKAGAFVGLNYRDSEKEARTLHEEFPKQTLLLPFDVRDAVQAERAVGRFQEQRGHIDGWVNNAAVNRPGLLVSAELDQIREQIETNLLGPVICSKAVLPVMM